MGAPPPPSCQSKMAGALGGAPSDVGGVGEGGAVPAHRLHDDQCWWGTLGRETHLIKRFSRAPTPSPPTLTLWLLGPRTSAPRGHACGCGCPEGEGESKEDVPDAVPLMEGGGSP